MSDMFQNLDTNEKAAVTAKAWSNLGYTPEKNLAGSTEILEFRKEQQRIANDDALLAEALAEQAARKNAPQASEGFSR